MRKSYRSICAGVSLYWVIMQENEWMNEWVREALSGSSTCDWIHNVTHGHIPPWRLPSLQKIKKLALTHTPDPNRPTRRGIYWKLALTRAADPNWLGEVISGGFIWAHCVTGRWTWGTQVRRRYTWRPCPIIVMSLNCSSTVTLTSLLLMRLETLHCTMLLSSNHRWWWWWWLMIDGGWLMMDDGWWMMDDCDGDGDGGGGCCW